MIVGLTGGVGTGKSLVSRELKRLGAHTIDADEIAREITAPGTPVYGEIAGEFGAEVVKADGAIDRKALGSIVFKDPEKLRRLNEITHPGIISAIEEKIEGYKKKFPGEIIVVDVPLLIEVGLHRKMDRVVVVYADRDRQVERIMERDGLGREDALRRIDAQMPTKTKAGFADFVIDGNAQSRRVIKAVEEVYARLKKETGGVPGK